MPLIMTLKGPFGSNRRRTVFGRLRGWPLSTLLELIPTVKKLVWHGCLSTGSWTATRCQQLVILVNWDRIPGWDSTENEFPQLMFKILFPDTRNLALLSLTPWKSSQSSYTVRIKIIVFYYCTYLVRSFWWHGGWRFGLESILGHESRIMGWHTGQSHGCLLWQIGAAIAIVWTRWVRVWATWPGITTVNAVQTAVRDERERERKGEQTRQKEGLGRDRYSTINPPTSL